LAYLSHRSICRGRDGGCDDEHECADATKLWMAELHAQVELFKVLDAAPHIMQLAGPPDREPDRADSGKAAQVTPAAEV